MRVGSKIGNPIKIDDATSTVSRGHYARICVEVDQMKPLISKFRLKRRVRRLEHEGIHLMCFGCGMYEHRIEDCPQVLREQTVTPAQQAKETFGKDMNTAGSRMQGVELVDVNPEVSETFGPWDAC